MGGIFPKYYSISHYSVEKGMVNHNNSICIYIGLDEVSEDGRMVGGEEWQEKVYDREEWRRLLRTARNHRILFMPMDWLIDCGPSGKLSSSFQFYTNLKVTGSIPDGVGIFLWRNPAGHTISLGLTHPLTEMSTRNNSWGVKAAGA